MYTSRSIDSSKFIQVQCKGTKGLGPEWVPLKQDWTERWSTLPPLYTEEFAERIGAFETRDSDVFVVSIMRSGTTWMQELSWLLLNNLDFDGAKKKYPVQRSPYLE
ncbi:hypothetical protein KR009_005505 [Drosophila setifemur]|nr:hypothetical protein KR009_005505 [Drosophila setifemur]